MSKTNVDYKKLPKKVAIVHDWLYGGGAELVVEQMHKLFPDAPIFATFATKEWRQRLDGKVITGWLGRWPFNKLHKFTGIFRIWWYQSLKLDKYDLVISSSGAEAKGIKVPPSVLHVNYCHAPTHYYWSRYDEYMNNPGLGPFDAVGRFGLKLLVRPLRKWDYKAAQRPDVLLANSSHIQAEIKRYYDRDSTVVFPPVSLERFQKPASKKTDRHGFIVSGRQTPYKRFDLAIEACNKLSLPLKVIGGGPDNARLKQIAGPTIQFLGRVSDAKLEAEFRSASALIFPGLDDFGITPVEAMAAGTPVLAYRGGGALDYVIPGKTGDFFDQPNTEALSEALKQFKPDSYDHRAIAKFAEKFSVDEFRNNYLTALVDAWQNHISRK